VAENFLACDRDHELLLPPSLRECLVQAYNAQAAVTPQQIVIAAEDLDRVARHREPAPMVATACRELEAAGVVETPGVVLADAGYWKNEAIEAIVGQGLQTLVAPDADRRKEPRPGRRGGLYVTAVRSPAARRRRSVRHPPRGGSTGSRPSRRPSSSVSSSTSVGGDGVA